MSATFSVAIKTPDRGHYDGPADMVRVSTELGTLQVYAGHAPLASVIGHSRVAIRNGEQEEEYFVRNGTMFMDPVSDTLRILVQRCDARGSIDRGSIKGFLEAVLAKLDRPEELNRLQLRFLEEERAALATVLEEVEARETKTA